ncbi:uncharacterized protein LOC113858271 isoform X2 [Abrus precatorius]|uniref:Uncharacterized protein LOC113858271 isoform X2 n=1 Tax=Abrus precatorius TaxID=3816 RepID=A0A8B8KRX7_ABRPR|nr:uncharacterized protein LOC113858271 isoform X2 [Abrus precatorius]
MISNSMVVASSLFSSSPCALFTSHKLSPSFKQRHTHLSLPRYFVFSSKRTLSSVCFSNAGDKSDTNKESGLQWPILRRWEVPWEWQTVSLTSFACGLGITTAVVLGIIYRVVNTFEPLPEDFFKYDWREPFNLQKGWLLWAGVGLVGALIAIALLGVAVSFFNGEPPQRETDALVRLLPLIGSSNLSTACLVGITGVLAPLLEENVFRGFFMTSLTKWVPTPVAVIISAAVFALAHLTPGEFPQLFVLGTALGFSYAQTHNLLTPITIHAFWNSGVILLLTFLQLEGYDVKEFLQTN